MNGTITPATLHAHVDPALALDGYGLPPSISKGQCRSVRRLWSPPGLERRRIPKRGE